MVQRLVGGGNFGQRRAPMLLLLLRLACQALALLGAALLAAHCPLPPALCIIVAACLFLALPPPACKRWGQALQVSAWRAAAACLPGHHAGQLLSCTAESHGHLGAGACSQP